MNRYHLFQKSIQSHLMLIYSIWAVILVILGTGALVQVIAQIGGNYGGFIWTHDPTRNSPFYVSFDLWRSLPPVPNELRFLDEIVTIDGRSPWEFDQVYAAKRPDDLVTYLVRRGHQELLIREHVRVFTLDKFIVSYGILYLTGLSYILGGWVLLHATRRKDLKIFSFAFLVGGGAWLSHSGIWGVHTPYYEKAVFNLLLYTPAMPMTGAILLHFACHYPIPKRRMLSWPFVPWIFYVLAVITIAGYTLTRDHTFAAWNRFFLVTMFVYVMMGMVVFIMINMGIYLTTKSSGNVSQQRILEPMLVASIVGIIIFVFLGMLPVLLFKYPLVPFEIWITLIMLFPPIMVYALRNSELIEQIHREASLREQYAVQVEELRNIRERTLHEVADALHDQVVPELRGLHFAAVALRRRMRGEATPALSKELAFISDTLDTVSKDVRAIMEGAKPVDWTQTSLSQALLWLGNGLSQRNRRVQVRLDVDRYDNVDGPLVKEALYWIARAALNNVQDHARATEVQLTLKSDDDHVVLEIVDDGVGFDVEAYMTSPASDRRHLGLTNMHLRAIEIGGRITITSRPGAGVQITVVVPRKET